MGFLNLKKQQGLAMVEFAVTLPFLLLLLGIMGEMGYIFYQQTVLNKALENGAIYAAKSTRSGIGLVKISAQTEQDIKNLVAYGNVAGSGTTLVNNISTDDISVNCTYGSQNGYCNTVNGVSSVSIQANVVYTPILGSLFNNVTGISLFPLTLSATNTVSPI